MYKRQPFKQSILNTIDLQTTNFVGRGLEKYDFFKFIRNVENSFCVLETGTIK